MKRLDVSLLVLVIFLSLFGLLMIYEASSFVAFKHFNDKYHYLKEQILWLFLGFTSMFFFSFFSYKKFYLLALPILLTAIVLLILVFVPGVGVHILGARRWIHFGSIILQPTEFVKLALAIYLAAWFSTKEKGRFTAFLLLIGLVLFLVILQPDMGTAAIILGEALALYFISGGSIAYFLLLIPVLSVLGFLLIKMEPYRAARLATFLDPNQSIQGSSYHVKQILIALGTGGLTGAGLGNSLQKYAYLPENTTDSIFAIIGEELGFIGATILIIALVSVVYRGFMIAMGARDNFGRLLAGGISCFLAMQMIVNLASQTGLIPLTGVPLPFISYGGSSLIVNFTAIGILLNITKQAG